MCRFYRSGGKTDELVVAHLEALGKIHIQKCIENLSGIFSLLMKKTESDVLKYGIALVIS